MNYASLPRVPPARVPPIGDSGSAPSRAGRSLREEPAAFARQLGMAAHSRGCRSRCSDEFSQRPRTTSSPDSSSSSLARGSLPARSSSRLLVECDDLRDVGHRVLGKTCCPCGQKHVARRVGPPKVAVSGTHTAVARRLRFKASPCTTTTGRRNPGLDPTGAGRSAHQISPCEITTRRAAGRGAPPRPGTHPARCRPDRILDSWRR